MSLPQPALSWVWLVDLERTVALLVGRCLGGMLQGAPTSLEEQDTAYWLKTPLFSNGLEMDIPQLGMNGTDILTIMDVLLVCFFCVLFLPNLAPPLLGAMLPPQFVLLCSHVLL